MTSDSHNPIPGLPARFLLPMAGGTTLSAEMCGTVTRHRGCARHRRSMDPPLAEVRWQEGVPPPEPPERGLVWWYLEERTGALWVVEGCATSGPGAPGTAVADLAFEPAELAASRRSGDCPSPVYLTLRDDYATRIEEWAEKGRQGGPWLASVHLAGATPSDVGFSLVDLCERHLDRSCVAYRRHDLGRRVGIFMCALQRAEHRWKPELGRGVELSMFFSYIEPASGATFDLQLAHSIGSDALHKPKKRPASDAWAGYTEMFSPRGRELALGSELAAGFLIYSLQEVAAIALYRAALGLRVEQLAALMRGQFDDPIRRQVNGVLDRAWLPHVNAVTKAVAAVGFLLTHFQAGAESELAKLPWYRDLSWRFNNRGLDLSTALVSMFPAAELRPERIEKRRQAIERNLPFPWILTEQWPSWAKFCFVVPIWEGEVLGQRRPVVFAHVFVGAPVGERENLDVERGRTLLEPLLPLLLTVGRIIGESFHVVAQTETARDEVRAELLRLLLHDLKNSMQTVSSQANDIFLSLGRGDVEKAERVAEVHDLATTLLYQSANGLFQIQQGQVQKLESADRLTTARAALRLVIEILYCGEDRLVVDEGWTLPDALFALERAVSTEPRAGPSAWVHRARELLYEDPVPCLVATLTEVAQNLRHSLNDSRGSVRVSSGIVEADSTIWLQSTFPLGGIVKKREAASGSLALLRKLVPQGSIEVDPVLVYEEVVSERGEAQLSITTRIFVGALLISTLPKKR